MTKFRINNLFGCVHLISRSQNLNHGVHVYACHVNTELKVSAINRDVISCSIDKLDAKELDVICKAIEEETKNIQYLEWQKVKVPKKKIKVIDSHTNGSKNALTTGSTYQSKKMACSEPSKKFAILFREEVMEYKEHIATAKAQYRRVREVKNLALQPESNVKMLCLDWSENVELFQTRQEKSQYYHSVSASVNTAVLYEEDNVVRSMATISDVKSHKIEATLASMMKMFDEENVDFSSTKKFYLVTDSPTSQYRNKKSCLLMKLFAIKFGVELCWIYTQSGHGKGPMDGVGSAVKRVVTDTISYNPNSVIRNTSQLMPLLPKMNVEIFTYKDKDVRVYVGMIPSPLRNLQLHSECGFSIGKAHEVLMTADDDKKLFMKKVSSEDYGLVRYSIGATTKRIKKKKKDMPAHESTGEEDDTDTVGKNESGSEESSSELSEYEEDDEGRC